MLILVLGLGVAQLVSLLLHLQERAELMAAGHVHPGVLDFEALPLRFLWHVSLTLGAVLLVALVAVRWATRPLQQMAEAFNFMQQRIRQLVDERGRALAAVSHDLRTPLTRMRLRVAMIDDPGLQARLNADIDAMQGMVNSVLAHAACRRSPGGSRCCGVRCRT